MIFMDKKDEASISIMKIIGISLIFILIFGVTVMATEIDIRSVQITMANGYTMTVVTTKTSVEEILEDNNIVVEDDERVTPSLDDEITDSNKIVITSKSEQEVQIAKLSESGVETSLDEILKSYSPIIEKIVVEQETIPYETITKDAAQGSEDTKNKVIQQGEDGIKEITYKVKYQNEEEIEKIKLSETVVKEPVNKIVQIQKNITSSKNKCKYKHNKCKYNNKNLQSNSILFMCKMLWKSNRKNSIRYTCNSRSNSSSIRTICIWNKTNNKWSRIYCRR